MAFQHDVAARMTWTVSCPADSLGMQPGQFRRPKGIAVDRDKIVYVVDSDFSNLGP